MLFKRSWLCLIFYIGFNQILFSQDWPQWRGPNRDGQVEEFDVPDTWPEQLTKVWSVEMGAGISSPVVGNGKIYLMTRDGDNEVVSCLDSENGQGVWSQSYSSPFFANAGAMSPRFYPVSRGKGPFATPLLHKGRLYTLGVDRILSSFDAKTGKLKWRHHYLKTDLPEITSYICPPCGCNNDGKKFEKPGNCPSCNMGLNPPNLETTAQQGGGNYYGAASSPIIVGRLGFVHIGNLSKGIMMAFDRKSGKERWQWEGPVVAYASPVLAEFHGRRQLVTMTRTSVVGISVDSGDLLWSYALQNNAHTVTPLVFEDLVIFATYRGPTIAIKIKEWKGSFSAEEAWKSTTSTMWMSSPVLDGDQLYGFFFSKKGQFASLDASTGAVLWESEGKQGASASLVNAENVLLALKSDGKLLVIEKGKDTYKPLAEYSLSDNPIWAYPAVWGKNILIKDESDLTLWSW